MRVLPQPAAPEREGDDETSVADGFAVVAVSAGCTSRTDNDVVISPLWRGEPRKFRENQLVPNLSFRGCSGPTSAGCRFSGAPRNQGGESVRRVSVPSHTTSIPFSDTNRGGHTAAAQLGRSSARVREDWHKRNVALRMTGR